MRTSSKFVITFLPKVSGLKTSLIKAEKAAGPIEMRTNNQLHGVDFNKELC